MGKKLSRYWGWGWNMRGEALYNQENIAVESMYVTSEWKELETSAHTLGTIKEVHRRESRHIRTQLLNAHVSTLGSWTCPSHIILNCNDSKSWFYALQHRPCAGIAQPNRLQVWSNWPLLLRSLVLHHTALSGCFWLVTIPIIYFKYFLSYHTYSDVHIWLLVTTKR